MALVKKQWAAKEKSQIEKITIRYEDGTERTVESGLVVTFAPSPEDEESEIMIINTEGIVIRMKCSDISQYGRITSGVKLINLPEKERVASVAKVRTASAEIDGEEVEIKEEDDSPENTSEIIVDNSEDNVSDDVENK